MLDQESMQKRYEQFLSEYLARRDEKNLYNGQKISRKMIEQHISPEEVVSTHVDVLTKLYPEMSDDLHASFDFLLEVMMGYGFAYREHQSLRNWQQQLENEIEIASDVQQSLLVNDMPDVEGLEMGVISRPAKQMSGDYYHFVRDGQNSISVAVADIIGKGIPAAMCMSMIKYSMDSVSEQRMEPTAMLESLNRVVEYNVDSSMFITMFYGVYNSIKHRFYYASAGHEPGFYYSSMDQQFYEMEARGLVLGAARDTKYVEYRQDLNKNDMIILLSDGVTECRTESGFIEQEKILDMIRSRIDERPQEIVERVYEELERLQDFELRDDFTLIIMKRDV